LQKTLLLKENFAIEIEILIRKNTNNKRFSNRE